MTRPHLCPRESLSPRLALRHWFMIAFAVTLIVGAFLGELTAKDLTP